MQDARILVTGAAGGLGTALLSHLVGQKKQVLALVRSESSAEKMRELWKGQPVFPLAADQTRPDHVAEIVAADIAAHGPVLGLVNNAAIYPKATAETLEPKEMIEVLTVNAVSAAALVRTCLPGMRAAGKGRIVNITSNTFDMGMAELGAYVSSKGALMGMTRVFAREIGQYGVTINCIAPGAFQTDAEKIHPDPEGYNRFVISQQAIKRRGDPAEFARLVGYMLSDDAGFITGQTIRIDGGWIVQ